jgi:ABC-2 type transport system permease protein
MISDILTILWKEYKEMFTQRPNLRGGWTSLVIFVGVFGILLPAETGAEWVTSPINLVYWAWVPFLMVSSVVADSFAGERERHTLETLLASRLSDRAILFGKLLASIVYGWGLTLTSVGLGLIVVNLLYGKGRLLFFPAWLGFSILFISFLISALAACLGVLVSLRASTVRQAQQTLSLAGLIPMVPLLLLPLLPLDLKLALAEKLTGVNPFTLLPTALFCLLVLDGVLLLASLARFRRNRLILD